MDKKALLFGLITGALAGMTTTLFNAPLSGKETREKMKTSLNCAKNSINTIGNDFIEVKNSVKTLSEISKETFSDVTGGLKTSVSVWQESTKPSIQKLQQELVEMQSTVEELTELQNQLPKKQGV
ncbi:YtxH domain-containing protein [Bacillus sp. REN10]|uniref:YtxH domain-containing protein n=1 Tax=Bacillus sp. REN10 TaxID=2782541 RepID=UPI00193BA866|nr:YtxH domain-containing protein [Bacillus sp. REN10]